MAKSNTMTILIVALVAAFFVLMMLPSQYVPYTKEPNYAKCESFDNNTVVNEEDEEEDETENPSVDYPPAENEGNYNEQQSNAVAPSSGAEGFEPMLEVPQSVSYGPFRDSEIIDKFSQVTQNGVDGQNGCVSSGLSNSGGHICLTPELIQMLKTRGGNATGGPGK